jgi:hypothetical protein
VWRPCESYLPFLKEASASGETWRTLPRVRVGTLAAISSVKGWVQTEDNLGARWRPGGGDTMSWWLLGVVSEKQPVLNRWTEGECEDIGPNAAGQRRSTRFIIMYPRVCACFRIVRKRVVPWPGVEAHIKGTGRKMKSILKRAFKRTWNCWKGSVYDQ